MEHLFRQWNRIESALESKDVLLFLDYDGTLTPIVHRPESARLSWDGKSMLEELSRYENVGVAVVSGRALKDIKRRIGIRGICYVGNHGLECSGPGFGYTHRKALKLANSLRKLSSRLKEIFRCLPGMRVEDKMLTLSVHYRGLDPERVSEAKEMLLEELWKYAKAKKWILREGKQVWEIRPAVAWEKAASDPAVHVLAIPSGSDIEINALQRASTVIVQKSLKEGFGLTVAEALWKGKPVVASAVGGITLQVVHKYSGLLSRTVDGTAYALRMLLQNPEYGKKLGENGREHVRQNFLLTRHLREYLLMFLALSHKEDVIYL